MSDSKEILRQKILINIWETLTTKNKIVPELIAKELEVNINFVWAIIHRDKLKNIIIKHNRYPNQLAYNPNA